MFPFFVLAHNAHVADKKRKPSSIKYSYSRN